MTTRRSEAERRDEVAGWRASGETIARYAARRGYSPAALRGWVAAADSSNTGVELVRVMLTPRESARHLTVEVGTARIRVEPSFDPALLRAVVAALSTEVQA
jgi:hypothetical protein